MKNSSELPQKRFRIVNESFTCMHCGCEVPQTSSTTPRNHCPFCLWSRHVDINPGDRANPCKGMMMPIDILVHSRKTYVIVHECTKCGKRSKSRAILHDDNANDDFEIVLKISSEGGETNRKTAPKRKKKKR